MKIQNRRSFQENERFLTQTSFIKREVGTVVLIIFDVAADIEEHTEFLQRQSCINNTLKYIIEKDWREE